MQLIGSAQKESACIWEKSIPSRGNKYRKLGSHDMSLECVRNGAGAGTEQVRSRVYKNDAGEVLWGQTITVLERTRYGQLQ